MPPQTSPIRMHRGMSMSPQRLSFSSAGAEEGRPIRSFEYSTSLPVGRSGWGQYLRQRGPRSECASSSEKTPLQQVVEAMVYMPKDLLEEVKLQLAPVPAHMQSIYLQQTGTSNIVRAAVLH